MERYSWIGKKLDLVEIYGKKYKNIENNEQ